MPNGMSDSDSQETPSSNASTPKSGTSIRIKAQAAENVCSLMSVTCLYLEAIMVMIVLKF